MDNNRDLIQELLVALLIWGKDKTFYNLCKLMWRGFKKEYVESNMTYKKEVLNTYMLEKEKKKQFPDGISKILSMILKITTETCNLHDLSTEFDKKYIKQVEILIEQAAHNNCLINWTNDKFGQLKVIIFSRQITKIPHSEIILKQSGQKINLINDGKEVEVEHLGNISNKPTLKRFIKMQNAILETYKKSLDTYCPWCNPKNALKISPRQRKCKSCQRIESFIYPEEKYKKENLKALRKALNMCITRIHDKSGTLAKTVKSRGEALLGMVKEVEIDKCNELLSHEQIECINLLKAHYKVDIT